MVTSRARVIRRFMNTPAARPTQRGEAGRNGDVAQQSQAMIVATPKLRGLNRRSQRGRFILAFVGSVLVQPLRWTFQQSPSRRNFTMPNHPARRGEIKAIRQLIPCNEVELRMAVQLLVHQL